MTEAPVEVAKTLEALFYTYLWSLWQGETMVAADDWVMEDFSAESEAEASAKYPRKSKEKYYLDYVASFWELAGFLVKNGLINEYGFMELFGGHPRTRWQKFERMYMSSRAETDRPEAKDRAYYFQWLARRVDEVFGSEAELPPGRRG